MGKKINEIGNRHGQLVVLEEVGKNKHCQILWKCRCSCGKEILAVGGSLRNHHTKSCGCRRGQNHGLSKNPLYICWYNIKQRCYNYKHSDYKNYGSRGIKLYSVWLKDPRPFVKWIEQNLGSRLEGYSLDRIDNNGNYEPGNLKWSTAQEQVDNRRTKEYKRIFQIIKKDNIYLTIPNYDCLQELL